MSLLPTIARGAARGTAPVLSGLVALVAWEGGVRAWDIPTYVLPGPLGIARAMVADWALLSAALAMTLGLALAALATAILSGVALALLFASSKWIERALLPYAVVLQVTPIVAIAPVILIWTGYDVPLSLLICAWLVAFFPILSNTTLGLNAADHHLRDLFALYGASRWQTLRHLRLPAALPYFLAGLRVSAGLSLIGAVVAEFVAGTGGRNAGLAYRILEAGYQLRMPRLFAALVLLAATGVAFYVATDWISRRALRSWHASAAPRER